MFCEKCNQPIAESSEFCCHCGAKQNATYQRQLAAADPVMAYFDSAHNFSAQAEEYKTARRKLYIRGVSIIAFMVLALIGSVVLLQSVLAAVWGIPVAFWLSCLVAKMFGNGLKAFFKGLVDVLSSFIFDFFGTIKAIGGIVLIGLVVLLVVSAVFSWLAAILLLFGGILISASAGLKEFGTMQMYKEMYENYKPQ